MQYTSFHLLKKAPFLRILPALIAGILLQWYTQLTPFVWWMLIIAGSILLLSFFYLGIPQRFRHSWVSGLATILLFAGMGGLLAWQKDIRNTKRWIGNQYNDKTTILVSLDEPVVEKTRSLKANAVVHSFYRNDSIHKAKGKIILYFKKDSSLQTLPYGTTLLITKPLQEIKNGGNPGGFDYKRYCLFQGITHQVFLKAGEFVILKEKNQAWLKKFIYDSRSGILNILRKNIREPKELGLAEALLIGYKDDLEQSLVQSYTNTGVVHVIAISGLHLGLIYVLLVMLFKPLSRNKKIKWIPVISIIAGLWLFSLLAGAQPSVLRSALMFTCIVIGESLTRKTSIFNTLSLSAFILLCINPYWLWDVGFQLSYAAITGIILFMRPVYNWFYFTNKGIDFIWKLNAVTLAAQVFTVPVSIYHFHQFPNYFLLTNFIAVPLSSIILIGEILLCVLSILPAIAAVTGKILSWLIRIMNNYIAYIENISFSLWDGLQISLAQTLLLLLVAASVAWWLLEKSRNGLRLGLFCLLAFIFLRSYSFYQSNRQQQVIIYNVPQKQAIDFINGRRYRFRGDSSLLSDDFAASFHLKPARLLCRVKAADTINGLYNQGNYFSFYDKKILLLETTTAFRKTDNRPMLDLLILSGNPKLFISNINQAFMLKQVVIDGSVPAWKARYWKKDCDSLHIPVHDVSSKGAFVMKLR